MNAIVAIPQAQPLAMPIHEVERVALAIAKGGLFGSTDPNAVLTLCLLAQAEGQHPAVVFRDYHIIKGKPAKKADAMLRDFVAAGGKVEWHRLDNETADATFSHPAGGTVRIDWTIDRARTAGLTTDMWRKYPRPMLRARVISEGIRTVYPGATSGLYEVGEVQDIAAEAQPAREPLELVHDEPQEQAPKRVKLDGPYTSKTALWQAARNFDRELRACGDVDQLDTFVGLPESQELLAQLERDAPSVARTGEGLPDEFEPIIPLMAKLRSDLCAMEQGDAPYEPTPLDAG